MYECLCSGTCAVSFFLYLKLDGMFSMSFFCRSFHEKKVSFLFWQIDNNNKMRSCSLNHSSHCIFGSNCIHLTHLTFECQKNYWTREGVRETKVDGLHTIPDGKFTVEHHTPCWCVPTKCTHMHAQILHSYPQTKGLLHCGAIDRCDTRFWTNEISAWQRSLKKSTSQYNLIEPFVCIIALIHEIPLLLTLTTTPGTTRKNSPSN